MKSPISAVIMARNEEDNIREAIESVSFAAQIVVADTGSSDRTMEVARRAGAETHSIPFDGYGASKNRALAFGRCSWILSIDADERVSPELAGSIAEAVRKEGGMDGYSICRLTYFLDKPIRHSGWFPDYVLRLFRNGRGRFNDRLVHEGVRIDGKTGKLDGLLYHYSYRTLEDYLAKMNVYSSLNAREMHESGKQYRPLDLVVHPPAVFFKMYFQKAGFLDGFHGFLLAGLSSFHVMIKYLKLRELTLRSNDSEANTPDQA
jgi:glycosyltransferase involved in cell wall biosynthesis